MTITLKISVSNWPIKTVKDYLKPNPWLGNGTIASPMQGCWMVYLHTKNPNLGTFWRDLKWKMVVHLKPFGIL
jgi:hypothetical protein